MKVACVYGVPAGVGGLGLQAASALSTLGTSFESVHALGGGLSPDAFPRPPAGLTVEVAPEAVPRWVKRYTWLRWRTGRLQYLNDTRLGRWAAWRLDEVRPDLVYAFTQVGLESLDWARQRGIPSVLDNPNGHIQGFAEVYRREAERLAGAVYRGHPTPAMIERVEREYDLADWIRVSSSWAKQSLVARGVSAVKVIVEPQPLDIVRFRPPATPREPAGGPLRVCFVGSMDLRKGFVYLLRVMRALGEGAVEGTFVGATGDRLCRWLWERESAGLPVTAAPGDPVPAYHRNELLVLPSLEDGFGFVVAEAMACGLPVVVTDQCGAAELVEPGKTGWVVRAGDLAALAGALEEAIRRRTELPLMGLWARSAAEAYAARAARPSGFPRTCLEPRREAYSF
jgi:glycosyltransferase involved in cell wall biosynthesis